MAGHKQRPIAVTIIPMMGAFTAFYMVMRSPSFAMYRTVDIVLLIGSGLCIGAATVGLVFMLRQSRN